ncbi:hypothetical protein GH733_017241 [Mirounga leonina]|nr:hypothetical protein GH733_017241 [Mirounga leonina]
MRQLISEIICWESLGLTVPGPPFLDYFSERSNPFYDRTCNNEVVKMQRLTLEHLNQMVGVEFILLHAQEPILFIIWKQQRQSPTQVIPLADYYIIAGVIYQAPDLGSVINSRTKKEAEPIPETVKSEEKETTKNVQQIVSTKGPPEKRMRLHYIGIRTILLCLYCDESDLTDLLREIRDIHLVRKKTRGRGERRNDQFSGLILSKPDLMMFLEQEKQLWDVKRKETVAFHPEPL